MSKLINAVRKKSYNEVRDIIDSNTEDINELDSSGKSALWWSVKLHERDMSILLLQMGASVFAKSGSTQCPFFLAYHEFEKSKNPLHLDILDALVKTRYQDIVQDHEWIDIRDCSGNTLLHWLLHLYLSSYKEYKSEIIWLIDNGAGLFIEDQTGSQPLHVAAAYEYGNDQFIQSIYQRMLKRAYPWLFEQSLPQPARSIMNGYHWKPPSDNNKLQITYTFEKYKFQRGDPFYKHTSRYKNIADGNRVNHEQRKAFSQAMHYYASILNIEFIKSSSPDNAQLMMRQARLIEYDENNPTAGHTDVILSEKGYITKACVSIDTFLLSNPMDTQPHILTSENNSYHPHGYYESISTILHELGHSLGLKHPPTSYFIVDTIMSYDDSQLSKRTFPETIMPLDWLALRRLYKPNFDYHRGDDTYVINGNESHLVLIIDQDGSDTIDASSYKGSASVNLKSGVISTVGKYRFIIAAYTNIENFIGTKRDNAFEDNDLNNTIDLTTSKGESHVTLTKGNDTVKVGNGNVNIIIDAQTSSGTKRISGFQFKKDKLCINQVDNVNDTNSTETPNTPSITITAGKVNIILEGRTTSEQPENYFTDLNCEPHKALCEDEYCDTQETKSGRNNIQDNPQNKHTDNRRLQKQIDKQGHYLMSNCESPNINSLPLACLPSSNNETNHQPLLPSATQTNISQSILLGMATGILPFILGIIALYVLYKALEPAISLIKSKSVTLFSHRKNEKELTVNVTLCNTPTNPHL